MRFPGILLVRGAIPDVAAHNNERGAIVRGKKFFVNLGQQCEVVCIPDMFNIPSIAGKPARHVFREGQVSRTFDRDAVFIVDPAEICEFEVPGERRCLGADSLHHIAVAAQGVNVVLKYAESRPIVSRCKPGLGNRHTNAHSNPLPQRAGRGFDT
jgi:hypothetical protein